METNSIGDTSTGPKQSKKMCIRELVPEVHKGDRKIYSPFSLIRNSEEHNHRAKINDPLLLEDNVAAHVVGNHAITNNISDGNLESASREITNSHFQNENSVYEDTAAALNVKTQDAVNDHGAVDIDETMATGNNIFVIPVFIELNGPNCKNEEIVREDSMPSTNNTQHRNLGRKKLQKYRLLSKIYEGIGGSFLDETSDDSDELSIDPEDDSDDDTLNTFKEKRRTPQAVKPNLVGATRTKHVTECACSNDSELGSTRWNGSRKNKIEGSDMQVTNKLKRNTREIILDGEENTSEIQKDFLLSSRNERNRETTQEDIAMMILNLRDGSRRHFTEHENRSRSTHFWRNRIWVYSDLSDTEIMVGSWLVELSAGVNTKKSKTETIQSTASACSLPLGKQNESRLCVMNRNPSEFSALEAKKFMRCG